MHFILWILVCSFCVSTSQNPVGDVYSRTVTSTSPTHLSTESWVNLTTERESVLQAQHEFVSVISSKLAEPEHKNPVPVLVPAIILVHIILFVAVVAIAKRTRFREAMVSVRDRLQCRRPVDDDRRLIIDDDDSNC